MKNEALVSPIFKIFGYHHGSRGYLVRILNYLSMRDGDDHPARAYLHMASRQKRSLLYARGGNHTHLNGLSCID